MSKCSKPSQLGHVQKHNITTVMDVLCSIFGKKFKYSILDFAGNIFQLRPFYFHRDLSKIIFVS